MLVSLQGISDRVEGAELGTAYVRLDGKDETEAIVRAPGILSRLRYPAIVAAGHSQSPSGFYGPLRRVR